MTETVALPNHQRRRIRVGLGTTVAGLLIFIFGAEPGLLGLDRDPKTGFMQISIFLVGLGIICMGGYVSLAALWNGDPKSIISDIGQRLVATGYVIAVASGLADVFGFGSQAIPAAVPQFGIWQAMGVMLGQAVIGVGFILLIPFSHPGRAEPDAPDEA